MDAATICLTCTVFLVVTAVTYWRRGVLSGIQASLLALVFGSVLVLVACSLVESVHFLRDVRRNHAQSMSRTPNKKRNVDNPERSGGLSAFQG